MYGDNSWEEEVPDAGSDTGWVKSRPFSCDETLKFFFFHLFSMLSCTSASHKHCDPTLYQFSLRSHLELSVSVTHLDVWVCVARKMKKLHAKTSEYIQSEAGEKRISRCEDNS
jgi:hypothetical protein